MTSAPSRLRRGAILLLKCFSSIAYSLPRKIGYLTLKEFFKSDQYFLRLARSNKQTLQLYNISIDDFENSSSSSAYQCSHSWGILYKLHIRRSAHNPPREPSADMWVLMTANAVEIQYDLKLNLINIKY
jgi:hypothetical protein